MQVFEDPYDDEAVCSLIKGTALRELGKLDEALECLDFIRWVNVASCTLKDLIMREWDARRDRAC